MQSHRLGWIAGLCLAGLGVAGVAWGAPGSLSLTPAADSLAIYVSNDPQAAQMAYPAAEAAVGCNFSQVGESSEVACFATALRFALPGELAGQQILSARLLLTPQTPPADFDTQYQLSVWAESWTPQDFTFQRLFDGVAVFTNAAIPFSPAPSSLPIAFDVTEVVQGWVDGAAPNFGFLLEPLDYDSGLGENLLRATAYASSESADFPDQRPRLEILYAAPPPLEPPAITFSASPETIRAAETATLSWSAQNADICGLDVLLLSTSGSLSVTPSSTTSYALRCTGPGGSRTVTTTVVVEDVPEIAIAAEPEAIVRGETARVTWTATRALRCVLEVCSGPRQCATERVATVGDEMVSPASTTSYGLTCDGPGGRTSADATLRVGRGGPNPVTISAVADPERILAGTTSEIRWSASGASSCEVGAEGESAASYGPSGALVVSPEITTEYVVRCGGAVARVTVRVFSFEPPFLPFAQGMTSGPERLRVAKKTRREQKLQRARQTSISFGEGLWRAALAADGGAEALTLGGSYEVKSTSRRRQKLSLQLDPDSLEELRERIASWALERLGTAAVEVERAKARLKIDLRESEGKLVVKLVLLADDGESARLRKSDYKLVSTGPLLFN